MQVPTGQPRWEFFMADIPSPPGTTTHNPMDQLRCCEELAKSGNENKPYELNFVWIIISPRKFQFVSLWTLCIFLSDLTDYLHLFVQT